KTAKQYGLTPVFKLELRDTGTDANTNGAWSGLIGSLFTAHTELLWVDQYTAFAAHYAQLAQQLHMPFFIIGSELDRLTVDNSETAGKPAMPPSDTFTCKARRDCEWRHIAAAMRGTDYQPLTSTTHQPGGGYTGKLIYAATSDALPGITIGEPEWQNITWWDAVDYIGINAFFPLLAGNATSDIQIQSAWHHDDSHGALASSNTTSLFDAFSNLAAHFGRPILFTGAGYESASGSNADPGNTTTAAQDDNEQLNDMHGLLEAFSNQPWWLGVVWSSDYAIWPRDSLNSFNNASSTSPFFRDGGEGFGEGNSEPTWATNTEWAGDCLSASSGKCTDGHAPAKAAGVMLSQTYPVKPIPPSSD
ncbi:MAG TPA: hypothetical protein VKB76_13110, partial [Ktedonobacterales bacterium]|nr:hypothetical protein [Ktedonobacterales bacterium]